MNQRRKMNMIFAANIVTSVGSGITAFTIPWLIINMDGGERTYGILFIFVSIGMFFLAPYAGILVDRFPRKKILLLCEFIAGILCSVVLIMYLLSGMMSIYLLIILMIVTSIYSSVQIPALLAFTQESFTKDEYKKVNGLMEVQSQSATFISAGLVALLVGRIDLWIIFLVDVASFFVALGILFFIPYKSQLFTKNSTTSKPKMLEDLNSAWSYMKENKALMVLLMCSFVPFIMVLVGNYLNPVYIYSELGANPDIQGYASVIYALSAILGGIAATVLSQRFGDYTSIIITYIVYLVGIIGIILFPTVGIFLCMRLFAGVGNAGSRVLRKNIMMVNIPNNMIGKVNSFFSSMSMLLQAILVGIISLSISGVGALFSFSLIGILMTIGLIVMGTSIIILKKKDITIPINHKEGVR
ncbi:MFS transporter (plasmid) [Alkalihalophilus sp. As8PL]|uniref:MFS transporter n=1 Tax=Alkalihalophilus sp. As8PL TaxID=3237103 RepID=A0AB39BNI4_9BACI